MKSGVGQQSCVGRYEPLFQYRSDRAQTRSEPACSGRSPEPGESLPALVWRRRRRPDKLGVSNPARSPGRGSKGIFILQKGLFSDRAIARISFQSSHHPGLLRRGTENSHATVTGNRMFNPKSFGSPAFSRTQLVTALATLSRTVEHSRRKPPRKKRQRFFSRA